MNQPEKHIIRIRYPQMLFVNEVIKHGNKEKAYSKAYPKAKPQSCKPAACRLYNHPEIKKLIDEGRSKVIKKAFEKAMQDGVDAVADELLTLHEKRRELARIVRRQQSMNRCYKFKDHVEVKEVPVDDPAIILRAIALDAKLEATSREMQAECCAEPQDDLAASQDDIFPTPPEGYTGLLMYEGAKAFWDDSEHPDLTEEQYKALLKLSLTDDRVSVMKPHLTGVQMEAGCWIERDTDTGEYVTVCPAENIGMLGLDKIAGTEKVTSVNNDPSQNLDDQHIE